MMVTDDYRNFIKVLVVSTLWTIAKCVAPDPLDTCFARQGPVYDLHGAITVSLLLEECRGSVATRQHYEIANTAVFMVERINQMGLIGGLELGLNIFTSCGDPMGAVGGALEAALRQSECRQSTYSIGILSTKSIISKIKHVASALEIKTWPLRRLNPVLEPSLTARILAEGPFLTKGKVQINAPDREIAKLFQESARREGLCVTSDSLLEEEELKNGESIEGENDVITEELKVIFGSGRHIAQVVNGSSAEDQWIVIPSDQDKEYIKNLPNGTIILIENRPGLGRIQQDKSIRSEIGNFKELIELGNTLLDMTEWINSTIAEFCTNHTTISRICDEVPVSLKTKHPEKKNRQINELIKILGIENMKNDFFYDIYVKTVQNNSETELKVLGTYNIIANTLTFNIDSYKNPPGMNLKHSGMAKCLQGISPSNKCATVKKECLNYHENDFFEVETNNSPSVYLRKEIWVPAGIAVSCMGVLTCVAILIFIAVRLCKGDVMEGNPTATILLIISLIIMFAVIIPFGMEFESKNIIQNITILGNFIDRNDKEYHMNAILQQNLLCSARMFILTLSYAITFSIMLSRAIMLGSVGSEGGFLSHVNGYLQSTICFFMILVQASISSQLLITQLLNNNVDTFLCRDMFEADNFWLILSYDIFLLLVMVFTTPCIYRSQRNYMEGLLLTITTCLILTVWVAWILVSLLFDLDGTWRDAAIPLGALGTACVILGGMLVPRSYLIVRGIARSDLAQALPSLTSISFGPRANSNHYVSDQTIYDCVNPAMRSSPNAPVFTSAEGNELPTLPMRAPRPRRSSQNAYATPSHSPGHSPEHGTSYSGVNTPNKVTRF